jgi:hypothetical protein
MAEITPETIVIVQSMNQFMTETGEKGFRGIMIVMATIFPVVGILLIKTIPVIFPTDIGTDDQVHKKSNHLPYNPN